MRRLCFFVQRKLDKLKKAVMKWYELEVVHQRALGVGGREEGEPGGGYQGQCGPCVGWKETGYRRWSPVEMVYAGGGGGVEAGEGGGGGGGGWRGRWEGLGWAVAAAFLTSVASLLVKVAAAPPGQVATLGFLATLALCLPLALYRGQPLFPPGLRLPLAAHSLAGSPILVASYQAVTLMPLADEAVLAYSSIVFTVVLARIYLKEPCGLLDIGVSLGVVAGVVLLAQPVLHAATYPNYTVGAALALAAALSDSLSYVFARRLTSLHFSVVLVSYSLACLPLSVALGLYEDWVPLSLSLVPVVVASALQEFLVTKALLVERAGLVALVQSTDVVFAYAWELALFDEKYSLRRVLGAGLVASMVLTSAFNQ